MSKVPEIERCCGEHRRIDVPAGDVPLFGNMPPVGAAISATPEAFSILLVTPQDVFDSLGIDFVKSFTVSNTSALPLTVTTLSGSIDIAAGQSFTWGDIESDIDLDVDAVRFIIQAEPVALTWEQ